MSLLRYGLSLEECKNVLKNDSKKVNQVDKHGQNALFNAHYDIAKLLIENGIDTNCVDKKGINVIDAVDDDVKELILHAPVKSGSKSARKR